MNIKALYIAAAMLTALTAAAQTPSEEKFAVKVTADIGLGSAMSVKSTLGEVDPKSSASDFSVDFGYTFWRKEKNSLEANIGLGYGSMSMTAGLPELAYSYAAPAQADMDGVPYIRHYQLNDLHQKVSAGRFLVPIYINYRYHINPTVAVHALAGFKLGFVTSSKVSQCSGKATAYGVYPIYDDLMIDASYMNEFGTVNLDKNQALAPEKNAFGASFMVGVGAEVRVHGPVYADVAIGYEAGFTNTFKGSGKSTFSSDNAPVTYTVATGTQVTPLSNFTSSSRLSRLSLSISLIYRF